ITGFVNWHRNRRRHLFTGTLDCLMADIEKHDPDHMAITGDLVNLASSREITAVTEWLEDAGDPANISIVPGNHDAYVPGAYEKTTRAWYPYMRADGAPANWHAGHRCFPYMRVRGPVALIGCSTAVATPPFAASGYFGQRQARATVNLLRQAGDAGLFRVVMIHHPPIRGATSLHKRMLGIRRFAATISSGGAELVIHGHTHLNTVYSLKGPNGPVPVVGISSASQGPGGHKPQAAYNLFTIAGEAGNWHLTRERYALNADATGATLVETTRF
ncbi:MAG: metallophosphoesterase family protein, partial [Ensifer adhaerens]